MLTVLHCRRARPRQGQQWDQHLLSQPPPGWASAGCAKRKIICSRVSKLRRMTTRNRDRRKAGFDWRPNMGPSLLSFGLDTGVGGYLLETSSIHGPQHGNFSIMLISIWDHFRINLGSFWYHFRINLGSYWDHFIYLLGPTNKK